MPLQLVTGYMKYRTDSSDQWRPIVVHTTPESGALLATTAQSFTSAQKQQLYSNLGLDGIDKQELVFNISSFSSLPKTINNSAITSQHIVSWVTLGNPEAQTDSWTVTTTNGSMTISGQISGSTTMNIALTRAVSYSVS